MTGAAQPKSLYCMSCGEDAPTYRVERERRVELRCAYCGFTLQERAGIAFGKALECIVLADDERLFRSLLSDILIEEHVGQEVIACEGGAHLLTECVRRFRDDRPISLVMLDILMKPMDGPVAALALRALEKGFDLPAPVPILFVSAVRADESLRRLTEVCAPALYLNKGKDAAPPRIARRIKELIPHLLTAARSG
jgi:CheY-like chemotaxis protein